MGPERPTGISQVGEPWNDGAEISTWLTLSVSSMKPLLDLITHAVIFPAMMLAPLVYTLIWSPTRQTHSDYPRSPFSEGCSYIPSPQILPHSAILVTSTKESVQSSNHNLIRTLNTYPFFLSLKSCLAKDATQIATNAATLPHTHFQCIHDTPNSSP